MSFSEAFPERTAQPPQIAGQPPVDASILNSARRGQLVDLAWAFNIPIDKNGTKTEILPVMIDAEKRGVFQGKPVRPEYLVKAMRSPDDPPVDWQQYAAPVMEKTDFRMLQRLAKEHGVDSFGKGKDELFAKLHDMGVV